MNKLLASFVLTLGASCAIAQSSGPINTPQLNKAYFFVGTSPYTTTIQSAVTAACATGKGSVVIPPGVTPTDSPTAVTGCPAVPIVDQHTLPWACYVSTGGTYAANDCGTGGGGSLNLTTNNTSGAATYDPTTQTLNIPVYVAPSGGYLALNPATGVSQTVAEQPGTSTTISQTAVGNVGTVEPFITSMNAVGQGWDCGNNGTACTGWSTQGLTTLNAYSATRGIMHAMTIVSDHDAAGDFAIYEYLQSWGGCVASSDECSAGHSIHFFQAPWASGTLVTPSIGVINRNPQTALTANTTYIWVGGDSQPVTFQTSGNLQTFQVDFYNGSVAATGYIVPTTSLGGSTFLYGTAYAVSIPALSAVGGGSFANVVTYTPADFGTIPVVQGQTLSFFAGAANAGSGSSFAGMSVAGAPTSGATVTATSSTGMQMYATLAPPTTGATSLTVSSINCNANCTDPRLGLHFPDDGTLLDVSQGGATATLGARSLVQNSWSYALTSGSTAVSSAWGTLVGSSCTNNNNGQYQTYTSTTCPVTLGTSPATPNNFVVGTDVCLSGPFVEEAAVTAVGTPASGVQTVTFSTRNAWNNSGFNTIIMQGPPCGQSMVATSTVSSWPVSYPIIGAFTSTQPAVGNCRLGQCNEGSSGTLPDAGTAVTFFPSCFITGSGNGAQNTATCGTNTVPFALGDTLVGAPTSEFAGQGINLVYGQQSPQDGGLASSGLAITEQSGSQPSISAIHVKTAGNATTPNAYMLDYDFGAATSILEVANRPVGGALIYESGNGSTACYNLWTDNMGGGSYINFCPNTSHFEFGSPYNTGGEFTAAYFDQATSTASAFAAGTTIGSQQVCLANGVNCPSTASGTPTVAVGGGAGAGATVTITGTNKAGRVTFNTGTGATTGPGTLFNITFSPAYTTAPYGCTVQSVSLNAATSVAGTGYPTIPTTTNLGYAITSTFSLGASQPWTFYYSCN